MDSIRDRRCHRALPGVVDAARVCFLNRCLRTCRGRLRTEMPDSGTHSAGRRITNRSRGSAHYEWEGPLEPNDRQPCEAKSKPPTRRRLWITVYDAKRAVTPGMLGNNLRASAAPFR